MNFHETFASDIFKVLAQSEGGGGGGGEMVKKIIYLNYIESDSIEIFHGKITVYKVSLNIDVGIKQTIALTNSFTRCDSKIYRSPDLKHFLFVRNG